MKGAPGSLSSASRPAITGLVYQALGAAQRSPLARHDAAAHGSNELWPNLGAQVRVLAVVSLRGGVGKTSMAINIASAMAEMVNDEIHLVDIDPQAGLTTACGYAPGNVDLVAIERFGGGQIFLRAIQFLSAASNDLIRKELEVASRGHHITIIDCSPGLHEIPLALSDLALLALAPSAEAEDELRSFIAFTSELSPPPVRRIVAVRTSPSTEWFSQLRSNHRDVQRLGFYSPTVPEDVQIGESLRLGLPVDWFAPDSASGRAYLGLALLAEYDLRKAKVERFLAEG